MSADVEAKPKPAAAPKRQVKALTRMENLAVWPDGTPKEEGSWVVNAGDFVPLDHPAVALHPTHFEGV